MENEKATMIGRIVMKRRLIVLWCMVVLLSLPAIGVHAFSQADLDKLRSGSECVRFDLSGADLSGVKLSQANLAFANLSGANLSGATITESELPYANLSGADLSGATVHMSDCTCVNLTNANLSGADLSMSEFELATWTDGRKCGQFSTSGCKGIMGDIRK